MATRAQTKNEATPQERLSALERSARFRVLVCSIVCAVALFLEFLLAVTLPAKVGMSTFLAFTPGTTTG